MAMEQRSGHDRNPKPVGGDLVLPILAVLYGGYYLYSILGQPFEAQINGLLIIDPAAPHRPRPGRRCGDSRV
jgi:hypothetical protein